MRCRQSKAEAAVSDEMMAFQHGFVGRGPIKAMRQQVLEAGRPVLESIVKKHSGAEVVSVHPDGSTKSGEWMDVFVLDHGLEEEKR